MPFLIEYPLINGHRFSFASVEALFGAAGLIIGLRSINYKATLTPGDVYGTAPQKIGRTRGKNESTSDCEMLRLEFENLKETLGQAGVGYGETAFDIVVQYRELNQPVITDTIIGARITDVDLQNADGTDASACKLDLNVMQIWLGGQNQAIVTPDLVSI